MVKALEKLSKSTANAKTKIKFYQLFTAVISPVFIVTLQVIAVYSDNLNQFAINFNKLYKFKKRCRYNHIKKLVDIL